jgi:hypothetical protein
MEMKITEQELQEAISGAEYLGGWGWLRDIRRWRAGANYRDANGRFFETEHVRHDDGREEYYLGSWF